MPGLASGSDPAGIHPASIQHAWHLPALRPHRRVCRCPLRTWLGMGGAAVLHGRRGNGSRCRVAAAGTFYRRVGFFLGLLPRCRAGHPRDCRSLFHPALLGPLDLRSFPCPAEPGAGGGSVDVGDLRHGLEALFPDLRDNDWFAAGAFGMLLAVFICLPWILRLALGLRPLPPGPLRDRLLSAAARLNFRFSDILLWDTHGGVANAMVVGVLRRPRYVVLSDRLISGLSEDELEAVFGHEVGHVKHHHMAYYLSFFFISVGVLGIAGELIVQAALGYFPDWARKSTGISPCCPSSRCCCFTSFWCSAFCRGAASVKPTFSGAGLSHARSRLVPATPPMFVCRRAAAAFAPPASALLSRTLEKVAYLNGISRSKPGWLQSWQHSTIARRVEFLQHMLGNPSLEPRFQRRVGQVKWPAARVGGPAGRSDMDGRSLKEIAGSVGCVKRRRGAPPLCKEYVVFAKGWCVRWPPGPLRLSSSVGCVKRTPRHTAPLQRIRRLCKGMVCPLAPSAGVASLKQRRVRQAERRTRALCKENVGFAKDGASALA